MTFFSFYARNALKKQVLRCYELQSSIIIYGHEHGTLLYGYVVDLETSDIVQLNDVEWEILSRYASQARYQLVKGLKEKYKLAAIFKGIERLERPGQEGSVLNPIIEAAEAPTVNPIYTGGASVGLRHELEPLPMCHTPHRVGNVGFFSRGYGGV